MTRLIRSLPFLYAIPAFFIVVSSFFPSIAMQITLWGMFVALHLYLSLIERVPPAVPSFLPVIVHIADGFMWGIHSPATALLFAALPFVTRHRPGHYPWYVMLSLISLIIPGKVNDARDFTLFSLFFLTSLVVYFADRTDILAHIWAEKKGISVSRHPSANGASSAVEDPFLALSTYCERMHTWQGFPLSLKIIEIRGEEGLIVGSTFIFPLTGLIFLAVKNKRPIPCVTVLEEKEYIPLLPEYTMRAYIPINLFEPDDTESAPEYVIVADMRYTGDKHLFLETLRPLKGDIINLLRMAVTFERVLVERKRQERLFRGAREILNSFSRDRLFNASAWSVFNFVPDAAAVLVTEHRDGEHRGILYRPPEGESGLFALDTVVPAKTEVMHDSASIHMLMLEGKIGKISEMRDIDQRRDKNLLFTDPPFAELNRHKQMLAFLLQYKDTPQGTLSLFLDTDRALDPQTKADLSLFSHILASALNNIEMYETVQNLSNRDGLTGLFNRRYLQERLENMVNEAARSGTPLAVIMLDIDHFKKINDRYGHKAGDDVIRFIARVIKNSTRKVDVAARYGGEEFIVLLHNTTAEGAVTVAEKIREIIQGAVVPADGNQLAVTASFGVSAYPELARSTHDLVKSADEALYRSKENGRNRVTRYVPNEA